VSDLKSAAAAAGAGDSTTDLGEAEPAPPFISPDLRVATSRELLRLYGSILEVLRERGVVRSENSPVGDVAELIGGRALSLEMAGKSTLGFDGLTAAGVRYQVKARRLTPANGSRQLSTIRGLFDEPPPFDFLLGILFDATFGIFRAAVVPLEVVRQRSRPTARVGGFRFLLTDAVWLEPGVQDVTEAIREAGSILER
jgi:hypothetical protein